MAKIYNLAFLVSWNLVITLGSFIYGFGLTYFNSFTTLIFTQYQHEGINVIEDKDMFNSVVTTSLPLGAMIGSYTIAPFIARGRRNTLLFVDMVVILGWWLTWISNFWTLVGARLLLGWGVGSMSVVCAVFVAEITPAEVSGTLATIVNSMICFGVAWANSVGFIVPFNFNKDDTFNNELYTTKMWRWIFLVPAYFAIIQSALLLVVFKNDSPKYYDTMGDT